MEIYHDNCWTLTLETGKWMTSNMPHNQIYLSLPTCNRFVGQHLELWNEIRFNITPNSAIYNYTNKIICLAGNSIRFKFHVTSLKWYICTCISYPSSLRAEGILSSRSGRAGGWQICETHISVTAWRIFSEVLWNLARSFAHLPHMSLLMDQKVAKFGTNWVQTLRNAALWKHGGIQPI